MMSVKLLITFTPIQLTNQDDGDGSAPAVLQGSGWQCPSIKKRAVHVRPVPMGATHVAQSVSHLPHGT